MTIPQEERFVEDGTTGIFFRSWHPTTAARAVVVIVPGFNSHSGYYQWVADKLVAKGFAAYAIDLRGRGKSDGDRFYVSDFADYKADVAGLIDLVKSREAGAPIFLLGHSAGGVVACLYALDGEAGLQGLISESFAHELPAPDFALAVIKGLSHVAPHAHVLQLKNEDFSRDRMVVSTMNSDPLIAAESQPSQTLAALVRADEKLKQEFFNITLPLLIIHGTADKAAKPSGSQHFYENAGSTDKTLKLYDGSFHDPLNDIDREIVFADIVTWVDARLAPGG
jgi:acylglycerol lipase